MTTPNLGLTVPSRSPATAGPLWAEYIEDDLAIQDAFAGSVSLKNAGVPASPADATSAVQAILAAAAGGSVTFDMPLAIATGSLEVPLDTEVVFRNIPIAHTYAGPLFIVHSRSRARGRFNYTGNDDPAQVVVKFGTTGVGCTNANWDDLTIFVNHCAQLVHFFADVTTPGGVRTGHQVSNNRLGEVIPGAACVNGVLFETADHAAPAWCNNNRVRVATLAGATGDGVVLNYANGNVIEHADLEGLATVAGHYALKLIACDGFRMGGWQESNNGRDLYVSPGDTLVLDVELHGTFLDLTGGAAASIPYSENRSFKVFDGQFARQFGREGFARIDVGKNALAANDQSVNDRFRAAGGMYNYRFSVANPYFYFHMLAADAGYQFRSDPNGTPYTMLQLDSLLGADHDTALSVLRRTTGGAKTTQKVTEGVADSGGAGFRLLRVPN